MGDEKIKDNISENLQYYMDLHGINNRELAQVVNVSESTVGKWLLKKSVPRMGYIEIIARYFNIKKSDIIENKKNKKIQFTKNELEIINNYQKSNEQGKKIILDTSRNISKAYPAITRLEMINYLKEIPLAAYDGNINIHTATDEELYNLYKIIKEEEK